MRSAATIQDFAAGQMNRLLNALAFQLHRAVKSPGEKEIHDVRVSIRRFSQGLRLFAEFFPRGEARKIERRLKRMLRLTSEIRNRDIALEFLARSNRAALRRRLEKQRKVYQGQFLETAGRWSARDFSARWRNRLSLGGV
ncbi:MAG: CHAD domain-containing protein [Acidobacteriia bacterium]|nr:CHAD domain-containing protein [Terriglobia bacterium]